MWMDLSSTVWIAINGLDMGSRVYGRRKGCKFFILTLIDPTIRFKHMVVLMVLPVDILDSYLGLEMRLKVYRCKMV